MNSEKCGQDVYKNGKVIGFFNMPKAKAEEFCKSMTEQTGQKHDWHYVGGRVCVKALPSK